MELQKFFYELKNNTVYLVPVSLLLLASMLHIITDWPIFVLVLIQAAFLFWSGVVAYMNKFVFWPAVILCILFIIINGGVSVYQEYKIQSAYQALEQDDTKTASELIDSIGSEKITKSKQYSHLHNLIDYRAGQQIAGLVSKARLELKQKKTGEARKTVSEILEYDEDHKTGIYLSGIVKKRELAETEKTLSPKTRSALKKLRKQVTRHTNRKKYTAARDSIDDFLTVNSEIEKENILIKALLEYVDKKEKGAEIARQRKLNYKNYRKALSLYRKRKYSDSIDLLEEVLESDANHKKARRLLAKAETRLSDKRWSFWIKVFIIGILIVLFVRYIRKNY